MKRVVVRPRVQVPVLVVLMTGWTLVGVTYFTNDDVVARRDWFGIALGIVSIAMGLTGIWRALCLGMVIDDTGLRLRHFDSRDRFIPWSDVRAVDCAQIDERAGIPLYAPVIEVADGAFPVTAMGSYSRRDAERKADSLRAFVPAGG